MSAAGDLLARVQRAGIANLQRSGSVNHNHTATGHTIPGRAGNPSIAPVPHVHPGKRGRPAPEPGVASTKRGHRGTAAGHALRTTTHVTTEHVDHSPTAGMDSGD